MAAPKRGLGRGLGALIPTELVNNVATSSNSVAQPVNANLNTVPGITFSEIDLNQIKPNAKQPRQIFEEDALTELTFSLKEIGLLQPIVVRAVGTNQYEIVAGERRFRAAKLAGFTKIPALIRDTLDTHMLRDALLENLHRAQLNPLEEAAAYQQLLEDFGGTQEELAAKLGRSRPQVTNTMRLLKLPPTVQKRVAAGVLSSGHAKALLGLAQSVDIENLASRIVAEGLSVRATEEIVSMGPTGSSAAGAKKLPTLKAPGLTELADRLGDKLDTRVSITMGKAKGKVVIEFSTLEDLRRIVAEIEKN
ncbi:MAG: ParB/RepB/Spo0J family partition protein [Candidatus Nanopelagicales bacterium]|jgi:ParB family chromosome partitioning protein|nr:ParB/RepB/Spo0J family partition protein [Candidatus Nanopelagicales bacterium]MBJ7394028.1 ParB/RepB/Spo0J family partition protein [Candidatus Nanopelagicales bacterium]